MTHPNFRRAAVAIAATLACAAFAPTQAQTTATTTTTVKTTTTKSTATKKLGSGIDRSGMDTSVRPQDDLYLATNGNWVKNTADPGRQVAPGARSTSCATAPTTRCAT